MKLNVGKKYTFKRHSGRGRPFVGKLVHKEDDKSVMKVLSSNELMIVKNEGILKEYDFVPYKKAPKDNHADA